MEKYKVDFDVRDFIIRANEYDKFKKAKKEISKLWKGTGKIFNVAIKKIEK